MLCLGIETSCDETALALIDNGRLIDSVLASQVELHAIFGGVVPELASREHYRFIGPLFDQLLARNNINIHELDVIAAARGPGLLGSLLIGVAFGKGLALALGKPFIGVNHLHAHLLAIGLENPLAFPSLGLLVSGGHTEIYLIESINNFICLGQTLDDAAGEAFDKIGKKLGLPYPAGKIIDDMARNGREISSLLPNPFLKNDNMDFSFSGLKTAAIQVAQNMGLDCDNGQYHESDTLFNFCASINHAISATLCEKVRRALEKFPSIKTLWLAGGVAANNLLRQKLASLMESSNGKLICPDPVFCTDNGAMIAFAGYLLAKDGYFHNLDMEAIPRGRRIPNDLMKDIN